MFWYFSMWGAIRFGLHKQFVFASWTRCETWIFPSKCMLIGIIYCTPPPPQASWFRGFRGSHLHLILESTNQCSIEFILYSFLPYLPLTFGYWDSNVPLSKNRQCPIPIETTRALKNSLCGILKSCKVNVIVIFGKFLMWTIELNREVGWEYIFFWHLIT